MYFLHYMKTIFDYDFKNRKASVRVDFNVPLNEAFEITDDSRIAKAIPTLQKILNDGGSIILMSHLGRPKGEAQNKYSLIHIKERIGELLGTQVKFTSNCLGDEAQEMAKQLQPGEVFTIRKFTFS